MAFHNVQFPTNVNYGTSGGPGFQTQIISLDSGAERRVSRWSQPRHTFNAAFSIRKEADLSAVKTFYIARQGAANSFRYKDWSDLTTTEDGLDLRMKGTPIAPDDQLIASGNGVKTQFQLVKRYTNGGVTRVRTITKPIASTVKVAIDGAEQLAGWSVDETTGILTFSVAPANGAEITWGGEFDVHVRFGEAADELLNMTIDDFSTGSIPSIEMIEIVEPDAVTDEFFFGGSFVQALTKNLSLNESIGRVYSLDPNGQDRDLNLPIPDSETPSGGPWFYVNNRGGANNLRLVSQGALVDTVAPGETKQLLLSVSSNNFQWIAF